MTSEGNSQAHRSCCPLTSLLHREKTNISPRVMTLPLCLSAAVALLYQFLFHTRLQISWKRGKKSWLKFQPHFFFGALHARGGSGWRGQEVKWRAWKGKHFDWSWLLCSQFHMCRTQKKTETQCGMMLPAPWCIFRFSIRSVYMTHCFWCYWHRFSGAKARQHIFFSSGPKIFKYILEQL